MNPKYEVRSVNPDSLIKAGFRSNAQAQAWIDRKALIGRVAYYVASSPSR